MNWSVQSLGIRVAIGKGNMVLEHLEWSWCHRGTLMLRLHPAVATESGSKCTRWQLQGQGYFLFISGQWEEEETRPPSSFAVYGLVSKQGNAHMFWSVSRVERINHYFLHFIFL